MPRVGVTSTYREEGVSIFSVLAMAEEDAFLMVAQLCIQVVFSRIRQFGGQEKGCKS